MRALVMDGSAALGFLMADGQAPQARRALEALERGVPTFVPPHWALEIANGLLMAERRRRISRADAAEAVEILGQLPVETDDESGRRAGGETAGLARQYGLTVYDAAYLELALRRGAALATGDAALAKAARQAGVDVIGTRLADSILDSDAVPDSGAHEHHGVRLVRQPRRHGDQ